MKLNDLLTVLDGRENLELHIDGLQLYFTAANPKPEWMAREVESVRVNSQVYLGLIIHLKSKKGTRG